MSFNNLGLASKSQGDHIAAMTYLKTANRIYVALLGELHPFSVQTNHEIHRLYGFWTYSKFTVRETAQAMMVSVSRFASKGD